ncbi:MFS transporter [Mycobacterium sp. HNNTM2301]|uniref:MFS transporter n=1 Tax=Mycobacterium hainanense TaxID=3289775 RepID=UPI0035A73FF9
MSSPSATPETGNAPATHPSSWDPLRSRVYRRLFAAQFGSNIGTWMQSVAAQWFLIEHHATDVVVALVQTASQGPTLLLGLLAGALADVFDRRRLLIVLQSYAVVAALVLAALAYAGYLTPTTLLVLTAAIGCAAALTAPAWQAIQPELIPREQIPAASTLASMAANAARAIGPAIGGIAVAVAGAAAVFGINAVSFVGIIVALLAWKRPTRHAPIQREPLGQAIINGLMFVKNGPIIRRILLRAVLFLLPASAVFALLPVAAAHRWHLSAGGYGAALGAIGCGAVLAVGVAAPLHRRLSANRLLALSAATYGLAPVAMAWLPFDAALPLLVLSGAAWLLTLTTLNAEAQMSLPRWVRARGLSVYLLVSTGTQAIGSYLWGVLATQAGLTLAMTVSAAVLGTVALSVVVLPLRPSIADVSIDVSNAWPTPTLMFEPCPNDGPVLVTVRYQVPQANVETFLEAMGAVRRSRLRTGGHSWRLYHSVEHPDRYLERFTVTSWSEFERQRTQRWLDYDQDFMATALAYTLEQQHDYYVARRVSR